MCVVIPAAAVAAASLVATAASTAVAIVGSQQQAAAQSRAAAYQAQVAQNNAQLAREQGDANAQAAYRQNDQRLGMMRAAMGANGVDPSSGSALQIQQDVAANGGMDVANTRYNAGIQATGFRQQALLDSAQSQNAQAAGQTAALSSLIGGASQFASRWQGFQQQGVLS